MDTEYILNAAWEQGELSPLQFIVLQRSGYAAVNAVVEQDHLPEKDWLQTIANKEIERLTPIELKTVATLAYPLLPEAAQFLQQRLERSVQLTVQDQLHLPFSTPRFRDSSVHSGLFRGTPLCESQIDNERVLQYAHADNAAQMQAWLRDLQILADSKSKRALAALPLWGPPSQTAPRRARSAIKKAIALFEQLNKLPLLRQFLNRDKVILAHPQSAFQIVVQLHNAADLIHKTITPAVHSAFPISVETKAGEHIARLCLYLENTPILDQLLALSLYVDANREDDLLQSANWFAVPAHQIARIAQLLTQQNKSHLCSKLPTPAAAPFPLENTALQGPLAPGQPSAPRTVRDQHWDQYRQQVKAWIRSALQDPSSLLWQP